MNPTITHTAQPAADEQVTWFGASRRIVGGEPDSRYGWMQLADGPCIVKAMDPQLVAYNKTLLDHERRMLCRLAVLGAPAPTLIDVGRDDWLVTRFAGLSMQRLEHPAGLQGVLPPGRFDWTERLAAWIHLLRRLQPMADAGVLAIDLWQANVVLPLTNHTSGQLRLHEAALIDHAHTLEAGMALRRPVWIDRDMARIAPELRDALRRDQEALIAHFGRVGAALPGYSRLPGERDAYSRRIWAEYDAQQALQQLLDAGQLSRDHAMQYAAGKAMAGLLGGNNTDPRRMQLARALQRMTEPIPARRYETLGSAADTLTEVLEAVPLVSRHHHVPIEPADLAMPEGSDAEPNAGPASTPGPLRSSSPLPISESVSTSGPSTGAGTRPQPLARARRATPTGGWGWIYAAAAAGAALGMVLPLRW